MPTIQILPSGQIPLPTEFQKALSLNEGDFLDVELKDNQIVLRPKILADKQALKTQEAARERLLALLEKSRARNQEVPLEEIDAIVQEAVQAVREETRAVGEK